MRILIFIICLLFSVLLFAQTERDELFFEVETLLNRAILDNANVLSAEEFSDGLEEYLTAKKLHADGKSPIDIRKKLESSISYLTEMNNNLDEKHEYFSSVIEKRNSALDSGADKNAQYYWELGERKLQETIEDFEDNDTKSILKDIQVTKEYFSNAKLYSSKANFLIHNSESINNARTNLANLIAPISYEKAEDKLFETLNMISSGDRISSINNSITNTELLFNLASAKASKFLNEYPKVILRRNEAKMVKGDEYALENWRRGEDLLKEAGEEFEKGDFDDATELAKDAETNYAMAKEIALKDFFLNDVKNEIDLAIEEGAEEFAPKTLAKSKTYLNDAILLLESDSYSLLEIKQLTEKSLSSAKNARRIAEIAKRMEPNDKSWEDIILSEQGYIIDEDDKNRDNLLENENNYGIAHSDITEKLDAIISDEAEIIEQNGIIVLRLKNVNFNPMVSKLDEESKLSLDVITDALKNKSFSEATIVCYTDNVGTRSTNKAISKKRAESILNYILTKDKLNRYYIEGRGEENPIATNATPEGRKKNRRVEIEIKR